MKSLSTAETRSLEQQTILSGINGFELMTRAGRYAEALLEQAAPEARRFVFLCGSGNNGGDALVCASCCKHPAVVYALRPAEELHGEAAQAAQQLPQSVPYIVKQELAPWDFLPGDLIVDGLLGIGYSGGELRPRAAQFIAAANASGNPVWALDVPSGLNADTGEAAPSGCIHAAGTITFGCLKRGLFCGDGPECRGVLRVADIGFLSGFSASGPEVFTEQDARRTMPRWNCFCHKNTRGRVLIAAGSLLYPGAAALAATASLKAGAGLVRLVTAEGFSGILPNAVICRKLPAAPQGTLPGDTFSRIEDFSAVSDVLAAGCGWGEAPAELLSGALAFPGAVLLDADALNLAARHPELWIPRPRLVLTPHPGEAQRLSAAFGVPVSQNRREWAAALARRLGAVVLLKGRDTVIADPEGNCVINASGSVSLATAGSGDVLTGVISALLAAGLPPFQAACTGAWWHGTAGEMLPAGSTADEIAAILPAVRERLLSRMF